MSTPSIAEPRIFDRAGQPIALASLIAEGGEGAIWRAGTPGRVVKLYHHPTAARAAKLEAMVVNRPPDPSENPDQPAIAWPEALVYDEKGACIGFEMREVIGARTLPSVYLPALRKAKGLDVDWRYLHATAYNVAVIMKVLHKQGYVIGDLKPQNLLVNARAVVTIIDTDSFQVGPHRCQVGSEGFTPPELIGLELAELEQTPEHDRFRLGVLVYLVLFGRHPFQGVWAGEDDPPPLGAGPWCHAAGGRLAPPPGSPPLEVVGPELAGCLRDCFEAPTPAERPDARRWARALREAMGTLARCERDQHYHHPGSPCPWCRAAGASGLDVFAARPAAPQPADAASPWSASTLVLDLRFSHLAGAGKARKPDLPERDPSLLHPFLLAWWALLAIAMGVPPFLPGVKNFGVLGFVFWYGTIAMLAFVGWSMWAWARERVWLQRRYALESIDLAGTVTDAIWKEDSEGYKFMVCLYEFTTPAGQVLQGSHELWPASYGQRPWPTPGAQVVVAYLDDQTFRPY